MCPQKTKAMEGLVQFWHDIKADNGWCVGEWGPMLREKRGREGKFGRKKGENVSNNSSGKSLILLTALGLSTFLSNS